jgi:superfamily I DNA and/or RNA helicase
MLSFTQFYSESLIPAAPDSTQNSLLHNYHRLSNRFPVSFVNIDGKDEPVDEHSSFWNEQEVDIVKSLVIELVSTNGPHGILLPSQISVISPFREQVWRIRLALRKVGLGDVDVGNVEALQGSENRVVIISTVRSRSQIHLRSDRLQHRYVISIRALHEHR